MSTNPRVADDFVKTTTLCMHCSEPVAIGRKFCNNCDTAPKRQEMCKWNEEVFAKEGLVYKCPMNCNG